jgi:hypothetical protein
MSIPRKDQIENVIELLLRQKVDRTAKRTEILEVIKGKIPMTQTDLELKDTWGQFRWEHHVDSTIESMKKKHLIFSIQKGIYKLEDFFNGHNYNS